ncbi:MAG: S-layer homology domain-containing protein, partial [bacterium]|nr:S-layer homology domain-containing protein [bacterium]
MRKVLLVFGLAVLLLIPSLVRAGTFEDVKDNHWAYKSVESLAEKGIVKGIPKNNKLYFEGSKYMTRYEFAVA